MIGVYYPPTALFLLLVFFMLLILVQFSTAISKLLNDKQSLVQSLEFWRPASEGQTNYLDPAEILPIPGIERVGRSAKSRGEKSTQIFRIPFLGGVRKPTQESRHALALAGLLRDIAETSPGIIERQRTPFGYRTQGSSFSPAAARA